MAKTGKKSISTSNTGEIVLAAIKKLTKNTGWTARTVIKFIKMEYDINEPNLSRKVSRSLKRGIKLGLLQMEHGRYRLNDLSHLVHPIRGHDCIRQRPLCLRSVTPSYEVVGGTRKRTTRR